MLFVIGVAVQRIHLHLTTFKSTREAREAFLLAEINRQGAYYTWAA